ncbi:MAG: DNA-deoxyinosine glycosylase [Saccharospirillum sp.]
MPKIQSFPPIEPPSARVLILGSMPGKASLQAQQYYAHPRNVFWPIMATLLGFSADLPYPERTAALQQAGVGLWDVLHSCERESSLDSDIQAHSMAPNDFNAWFERHPETLAVLCNGGTAYKAWCKRVQPLLKGKRQALPVHPLPSTSPAYAAMPLADKQARWQVLLNYL